MARLALGPFAAMVLADMPAQVLCIERPDPAGKDSKRPAANILKRNRHSIAPDLKKP